MQWRQVPGLRFVLAAAPIVGWLILAAWLGRGLGLGGPVVALISAAGALALYVGYVRVVEQRPVHELAGAGAAAELSRGLLLGASLFVATTAVLCALGACTIERVGDWHGARAVLAGSIAAAVTEEILVRAILFRMVEARVGTWIALAVSAVLFGVLHAFNPGATAVSTVAIALEAGILLAAALVATRRLWLPFGLHAAWNFTEGGVFGANLSGNVTHGLLASRFRGAPLVTGGAFGPEASIVAVAICLAAGVALLVVAHRRGRFARPRWRH